MFTTDEVLIMARALGDSTITNIEKDIALGTLKKLADSRNDWTEYQKNQYKMIVDKRCLAPLRKYYKVTDDRIGVTSRNGVVNGYSDYGLQHDS